MFQNLVESLPRRVEAVIAKGGPTPHEYPSFWNETFDEEVYIYFWSCSVCSNSIQGNNKLNVKLIWYKVIVHTPISIERWLYFKIKQFIFVELF